MRCEFQGGPIDGAVRDVGDPPPETVQVLGLVGPAPPSPAVPVVPVYTYKRWEVRSRDLIGPDVWRSELVYVVRGQEPRT